MPTLQHKQIRLARTLARLFGQLPQVRAVALGGSTASAIGPQALPPIDDHPDAADEYGASLHGTLHPIHHTPAAAQPAALSSAPMNPAPAGRQPQDPAPSDSASDIDVYVYHDAPIPLADRERIMLAAGGATRANLGLDYWGPGDEWYHAPTGIEVDMVYFDCAWMEGQLAATLQDHRAQNGYSTCFWHTIQRSIPLKDAHGWFASLQKAADVPYPPALARNIIAHNHPTLRGIIPSYQGQLFKALHRGDLPSINHRMAALLAAYFDILFAANRLPHPGEKRMAQTLLNGDHRVPQNMQRDLQALLLTSAADLADLPAHLTSLLDHLDQFLAETGDMPG